MKEIILAKYGEIILKGGNRPKFENILMNNIRNSLKKCGGGKGKTLHRLQFMSKFSMRIKWIL